MIARPDMLFDGNIVIYAVQPGHASLKLAP